MREIENELAKFSGRYPDEMIEINERIKGLAFFPGGDGLFTEDDNTHTKGKFPIGGIMILGQDFDSKKSFEESLKRGTEDRNKNKTWRNLLQILGNASIDPKECFFTNIIMGVRKSDKSTGKSPAFKDEKFIQYCKDFLICQINTQRPKLIIGLGIHIPYFLSSLSDTLTTLNKVKTWKEIDEKDHQIFFDVEFKAIENYKTKIVFITHPSLYHSNVTRRFSIKNPTIKGKELELALLKSCL